MPNIKHKPKNIEPFDENGRWHGELSHYYSNGNLWCRTNYVHGVRHGFCEVYFSDGQVIERGNYHMGQMIGLWFQNFYFLRLI